MKYQNYPTERFRNMRQLLRASAERFGERTLFIENKNGVRREKSFLTFRQEVEALGMALWENGLKGKKILICGENGSAWATAYMAVTCGLGVAVPIDRELPATEISALAETLGETALICSESVAKRLAGRRRAIGRIFCFEDFPVLIERGEFLRREGEGSYLDAEIDPDALAHLLCRPRGKGRPRGVMLSHGNLCFAVSELCRMIRIDERDVFLSVLPMYHAYESTFGFLCPLYRGAAIAFGEGVRYLPRDLREYSPTVLLGVPALLETLYDRIWGMLRGKGLANQARATIKATDAIATDSLRMTAKRKAFSNNLHATLGGRLRLLISCGATVDPDVLAGFRAFGIVALQGYGVGECIAFSAINRDTCYDDGAAGLATPDTLLDICETHDDGSGEIRVKGDGVMLGYYGDPEATARVLRDGWLHTGDIGYIDERGFLFLLGNQTRRSGRTIGSNESSM